MGPYWVQVQASFKITKRARTLYTVSHGVRMILLRARRYVDTGSKKRNVVNPWE